MDSSPPAASALEGARTSPTLAEDALEALDAATRAIAEILDLEAVLQVIVERVRELVDARYAALGIADAQGRLERFITVGLDAGGARGHRTVAGRPRPARGHHPRGPHAAHPGHLARTPTRTASRPTIHP